MADTKRKISSLDKRTVAVKDSDYLVIDNGEETQIILMSNLLKDYAQIKEFDKTLCVDDEGYICLREVSED